MQSLSGTTRVVFLGFFASHIVFTLIVDAQAILPPNFVPKMLQDLLAFEVSYFNDPIMKNAHELLWFQALVVCEMLFQLPFFFLACWFLSDAKASTYPEYFRSACIAYGAHTATTMVPILATLAWNSDATSSERFLVISMYLPYLILPLLLLLLAATSPTSNKVKQK